MAVSCGFTKTLHYPPARRDETVVDDYFGHKIADPYRWLEDLNSEETKKFVDDQVKFTESVLEECELIGKVKQKIIDYVSFPRWSVPLRRANKYFHFYNSGLQSQNVYRMQDGLDGKPEVVYDPNLREGGRTGLTLYSVSEDANYFAFGIAEGFTEWLTIRVMKIEDRSMLPDCITGVKHSGIHWTHDNKGFFYCPYPPLEEGHDLMIHPSMSQEVRYHFIGTDQSEDILCWKDTANPTHHLKSYFTDDGKYFVLYILEGCNNMNKVYCLDLTELPNGPESLRGREGSAPFIKLVDSFDALYTAIANDGSVFTFLTDKDATRRKLVRVDLNNPSVWTDVIPESKDLLESAHAVNGNQLLIRYLSDVKHILELRDLESGSLLHRIPIDIGAVDGTINARRGDSVVFFKFTSILTPSIIYECDLKNDPPQLKIFRESVVAGFDRTEFEVKQLFAPSKDGTMIPTFVAARKGISLDGSHPCEMHGYGAYGQCMMPTFSASRLVFLKHLGGVFCLANIRGGGEYGVEWHKAGARENKQNSYDDFIASAEFLVSSGYTAPKKICIEGGSNGGLLMAVCITQRPDLFGCAEPNCGPMDMLRFHHFTQGYVVLSEYGSPEKEEEFNWLIKYSPLHNVRRPWEQPGHEQTQYPATMIITADHDDRVVPFHSYKMIATMQHVLCTSLENSPQKFPIICRIQRNASHYGRATMVQIAEVADRYGFMAKALNATWTD